MDDLAAQRRALIERFVAACQADARVIAAFLGGSYAREAQDAYSDIDFGVITTDDAYNAFFADRSSFIRSLGEPAFFEDWRGNQGDVVFFTFPDGVECELMLGRQSQFRRMHSGPYKVLLDKVHVLDGVVFPVVEVAPADQVAALRDMISWFWHDLSHHFISPLARGQVWSAYGALQDLRLFCVNLMRLTVNFAGELDGYEKVEQAVPLERLAPLEASCCGLERVTMLQAAFVIVRYFRELAVPLAHQHGIAYPAALERVMMARLEGLRAPV